PSRCWALALLAPSTPSPQLSFLSLLPVSRLVPSSLLEAAYPSKDFLPSWWVSLWQTFLFYVLLPSDVRSFYLEQPNDFPLYLSFLMASHRAAGEQGEANDLGWSEKDNEAKYASLRIPKVKVKKKRER